MLLLVILSASSARASAAVESGIMPLPAGTAPNAAAATTQTIAFANPGPQTVGTSLVLSATASSGLPVSFASSTANVCTVTGATVTFLTSGSCTITASQSGNSFYAAATPVSQTFAVSFIPAVPVPASEDLIVSQVNWLQTFGGNSLTINNPAGGSLAVNTNGEIVAGTGTAVVLFNAVTGAETTLGSWNGVGPTAVDGGNNIYLGNYSAGAPIVRLPYVGGLANGGYVPFTVPGATTPTCTSTSTVECTIAAAGGVNTAALTFDPAGDLFYATAYQGSGANAIYECSVACLAGTGSPVMVYQEPAATTPPSATSGQLLIGAIAVDPLGNLFFTDSSTYVSQANSQFTSFFSNLKELPKTSGGVDSGGVLGYALQPATLYSETPSVITPANNEVDALVINPATGTVYFADQGNGLFAFPNSGSTIPLANGQPTSLYTVSTQGAKALALDSKGNFYFVASSSVISPAADTVGQIALNSITVPNSPVGVAVSPSSTLNPVTTVLNDGSCSAAPPPSATVVPTGNSSATATISVSASCTSTVSGAAALATTVTFTPSVLGNDSATLTGTDQLGNTATVTVSGVGLAPLTPQTITFSNPGTQSEGTPLTLTATATSGLPVTFTSVTTGVCTVAGSTATFIAAGMCTIDASQGGNTTYAAAPQVQQSFAVTPAPSFTLVPSAGTLSVTQDATATDTVTVTPADGFTGSVTLTATGLPSGVTVRFGSNPATGASSVTFTASSAAMPGASTVTITGVSGSLSASTTIVLTVTAAPSFTLSAGAGSVSVVAGASVSDSININAANGFTGSVALAATGLPSGVTASFSVNPATSASVLTITASSSAPAGTTTVTLTGTSGTLTASTTISLTETGLQSFTLAPTVAAVSISPGGTATDTIKVIAANGFTGSVNLAASGLPSGVTASFAPTPATSSSVITLTATSAAAPGTATVTITGTSGTLSASTTLSVSVIAPASITVTPASASVTLNTGAGGTDIITVAGTNGFSGSVVLSAAITAGPQGAQDPPTLSFGSTSPVIVTPTASGAATLSITTTAATTGALRYPSRGGSPLALAGGAAMAGLLFFILPFKRRRLPVTLALAFVLYATGALAGCGSGGSGSEGGGGSTGTTAGNYTVTITATSGSIVQTTPVAVIVE